MSDEPMRKVAILLTNYSDWFARFVCNISKNRYSHASISIDEEEEIFYSFNTNGFVVEKPKKRIPKSRIPGSVCIRIQVPEDTYKRIKDEIQHFMEQRERYSYSVVGVVLCVLQIPHKIRNQYFCSQFVAEVLAKAGAVQLKKRETLYLPGQLLDGIEYIFSEKQIVYDIM